MNAIKSLLAVLTMMNIGAALVVIVLFTSTWALLWIGLLLIFFIVTIRFRDWMLRSAARQDNQLLKISFYLVGYTFLFFDWLSQRTLFTALFLDFDWQHNTITARLQHYRREFEFYHWRRRLAWWICTYLISFGERGHC